MSNMKSGFSTLNRWLGKKNKEKPSPNGKLSKSSTNLTNLSVSSININETSQLEYNRITPLPAATSNAPFEQTFRITVLLPKDQLYVTRLGARVPLSKLLELVCDNKLLDPQKYEFRNPVDSSQVYTCEMTIGAVGLSEIRLCHKSESYDTFNPDEVMKLHRTTIIRDSLSSSSEFSSRNSKITAKTPSPYSSSNSLNSMDSSGMNYTRTPVTPPAALAPNSQGKLVAPPPRKKRIAPRPPVQIVIPEKSTLIIETNLSNNKSAKDMAVLNQDTAAMPCNDRCISTLNLIETTKSELKFDCNGNNKLNVSSIDEDEDEGSVKMRQLEAQKNSRNSYVGSIPSLCTETVAGQLLPEPSPRKRLMQMKKKVAPAPPLRSAVNYDDAISITLNAASMAKSESEMPSYESPPKPLLRKNSSHPVASTSEEPSLHSTPVATPATMPTVEATAPKPVPRVTTTALLSNAPEITPTTRVTTPHSESTAARQTNNVSKVLLNRTPTPEPRSLNGEPLDTPDIEDDNVSKQADSGIGEPVPSPLPDSLPSEASTQEFKSTFESSSDDDDIIKIYNFKLGKTAVVKPTEEKNKPKSEELTKLASTGTKSVEQTPESIVMPGTETTPTPSVGTEIMSWNFAIPISPPPNFADKRNESPTLVEQISNAVDTPITPKIKARPVLNFEQITAIEIVKQQQSTKTTSSAQLPQVSTPNTPLNEIVDELSMLINEKRMDELIKKKSANQINSIEAAKPNTLTNFSIGAAAADNQTTRPRSEAEPTTTMSTTSPTLLATPSTPQLTEGAEREKLYRRNSGTLKSNEQRRRSITRADSFQTTAEAVNGLLNRRSSSQVSLTKLEQNGLQLNRRRSSSELSIGESPTLQSPEVIKTILGSRKNSLANSNTDGEHSTALKSSKTVEQEKPKSVVDSMITSTQLLNSKQQVESVQSIKTVANNTSLNALELKQEIPYKSTNILSAKPKDVSKTYRYSGPPSISFSTWNERPKVQVSIKNEGDYIFGGKHPNQRHSIMALKSDNVVDSEEKQGTEKLTIDAASPILRMGIPRKEYKVPITVKPLRDVAVEGVNTELQNITLKSTINTKHNSSNNYKSTTTIMLSQANDVHTISNTNQEKEDELVAVRRQLGNANGTLPRVTNMNRFTMPAAGISLLRSTNTIAKSADIEATESAAVPFGQVTLRRTGFKEKMLAKEQQEQERAIGNSVQVNNGNVDARSVSVNSPTTKTNVKSQAALNKPSIPAKTIIQSAKLELKLQHNTTASQATQQATIKVGSKPIPLSPRTTTPTMTIRPTLFSIPKSLGAMTPPPPPPPSSGEMPMLTALRPVAVRSNSNTPTMPTDIRVQLLEAIRNFKREELHHT